MKLPDGSALGTVDERHSDVPPHRLPWKIAPHSFIGLRAERFLIGEVTSLLAPRYHHNCSNAIPKFTEVAVNPEFALEQHRLCNRAMRPLHVPIFSDQSIQ